MKLVWQHLRFRVQNTFSTPIESCGHVMALGQVFQECVQSKRERNSWISQTQTAARRFAGSSQYCQTKDQGGSGGVGGLRNFSASRQMLKGDVGSLSASQAGRIQDRARPTQVRLPTSGVQQSPPHIRVEIQWVVSHLA